MQNAARKFSMFLFEQERHSNAFRKHSLYMNTGRTCYDSDKLQCVRRTGVLCFAEHTIYFFLRKFEIELFMQKKLHMAV